MSVQGVCFAVSHEEIEVTNERNKKTRKRIILGIGIPFLFIGGFCTLPITIPLVVVWYIRRKKKNKILAGNETVI